MTPCARCGAPMRPDPRRVELGAGRLRYVCVGGHDRYEAIPPVLSPERARNDALIEAWIARRKARAAGLLTSQDRPVDRLAPRICRECGQMILDVLSANQLCHPVCARERHRRRNRERRQARALAVGCP